MTALQNKYISDLLAIRSRGTVYSPFKGSGFSPSVTKALNIKATKAKRIEGTVAATKALNAFMSMRERKPTGSKPTGKRDIATRAQGAVLFGAGKQVRDVNIDYLSESAHGAIMDMKVEGLMDEIAELKSNPVVIYEKPPNKLGWGFGFPDLFGGGISKKIATIGAGVGIGLLIIVGIIAFIFMKGRNTSD